MVKFGRGFQANHVARKVDRRHRRYVSQSEALTSHVGSDFKFVVQSRIESMSVGVAGFFCLRVLFEATRGDLGHDWSIYPAGADLTPQLEFQYPVVHFDLPKFHRSGTKQIWLGMHSFNVPADGDALCNVLTRIGLKDGNLAAGVHLQKFRGLVFTAAHIYLLVLNINALFGNENSYAARVWGDGCVKEFQVCQVPAVVGLKLWGTSGC